MILGLGPSPRDAATEARILDWMGLKAQGMRDVQAMRRVVIGPKAPNTSCKWSVKPLTASRWGALIDHQQSVDRDAAALRQQHRIDIDLA